MKRRRWLWIGAATLVVLFILAAILAPAPRDSAEKDLELIAASYGLQEIHARDYVAPNRNQTLVDIGGDGFVPSVVYTSRSLSEKDWLRFSKQIESSLAAVSFSRHQSAGSARSVDGVTQLDQVLFYSAEREWTRLIVEVSHDWTKGSRPITMLAISREPRGLLEQVARRLNPDRGSRRLPRYKY